MLFSIESSYGMGRIYFEDNSTTFRDSEIQTQDGAYVIKYPLRCMNDTESDKINNKIQPYLNPNYVPLKTIDCSNLNFDYRNFSQAIVNSGILSNTQLRLDIFYFSSPTSKMIDQRYSFSTGEKHDQIFIQSYDSNETSTPNSFGYWSWSNYPSKVNIGFSESSKSTPLGYRWSNDEDISVVSHVTSELLFANDIDDDGFGLFHDYGDFYINESQQSYPLYLYHFRTPATGDPKRDPSSVFKVFLSVSAKSLTSHCSNLGRRVAELKSVITNSPKYFGVIEDLLQNNSLTFKSFAIQYFYQAESVVEDTINYISQNHQKFGIDGELLVENLKAISIIKSNSCLSSWNVVQIQNSSAQFLKAIQTCLLNRQITNINADILKQLTSNISSKSSESIPSSIFNEIMNLKNSEGQSKIDLLKSQDQVERELQSLDGRAYTICKAAIGNYDQQ